ncbi:MAG: PGPGW domain-containing protein [Candidatus Koribacter versatilis]|uniref:PGPGW domain-containing protein n=1 Tax=Candidatus Korobacter versatilis TaxID=658062 RepID=A0A932A8V2_9BACT|nr:PGPGW domain-containing protein [Candidatus Koribacter versatilis]
MKQPLKRALVLVVGWAFILLGIVGLFLPVLQGILFLLIGLVILSSEYVWAHHLLRRVGERFPKLHSLIEHAKHRAEGWIHRKPGGKPSDTPQPPSS